MLFFFPDVIRDSTSVVTSIYMFNKLTFAYFNKVLIYLEVFLTNIFSHKTGLLFSPALKILHFITVYAFSVYSVSDFSLSFVDSSPQIWHPMHSSVSGLSVFNTDGCRFESCCRHSLCGKNWPPSLFQITSNKMPNHGQVNTTSRNMVKVTYRTDFGFCWVLRTGHIVPK